MRIYNSMTNRIEEFKTIHEGEVNMYVCGPTVYDNAHIGNARPIIVFDTLRRLLEADGYKVKYVSNYTDVDDKIINKAIAENTTEDEITAKYIAAYEEVRNQLNTEKLDATPRVTRTMNEMIAFIGELLEKGYAYQIDGDVYFRVSKVEDYGKLSGQKIDDLEVGARIEENSKKENPLDFALWKVTDKGIMWDTPWGKGRPGWHTECVVMINNEFHSHMIDIHGGGMDLKFPHHENEIAQSEALYGTPIANYWVHNGMLNIDGIKMSKSLGNVWLAKDMIAKIGANVMRWLMLSTQYRSTLNITEDVIETAKTELNKVTTVLKQAEVAMQRNEVAESDEYDEELFGRFLDAVNEDINTPNGFKVIFDTVKVLNQSLRQREVDFALVQKNYNTLKKELWVFGILVEPIRLSEDDKELFKGWEAARKEKDFAKADGFRAQLIETLFQICKELSSAAVHTEGGPLYVSPARA